MNKQSLLEAGYREYPVPKWLGKHEHADWFLQKRIDDDLGKKFFINAYGYSFTHPTDGSFYSSIQFDVQFKLEDDESVNVSRSFYNKDCTTDAVEGQIHYVESFFLKMFESLEGAKYYELWGE